MRGRSGNRYTVNLRKMECDCGKWSEFGIPCSHVQSVCKSWDIEATNYAKPYYGICSYLATYRGIYTPLSGKHYWDTPPFELFHNETLCVSRRVGRDQTTRIRYEMDWAHR
ncbi:hypothetical protein BUALT_Bualt17G0017300 [Buddleja alternifolia]|uniref:SWIM-type domain-containing protein n=1 Tax=Buddleja alternifolia TaxID=168488 RepID=A0AAV6W6Z4_9LAMI|nr:hypothetical protein BUALT_Bualt17G0017300 [Buddleja alternifolia]